MVSGAQEFKTNYADKVLGDDVLKAQREKREPFKIETTDRPRLLAEVLKTCRVKIEKNFSKKTTEPPKEYYIIMILCGGHIKDVNETDDELKKLTELPVSVVIVGVGKSQFADLEKFCNAKRP